MALGFVNSDGGSGIQMLFQTWKAKSGCALTLGGGARARACFYAVRCGVVGSKYISK